MTIFFTSDTHFGHARIIELCKRPFASVEEMDETLVANWNARVQPNDIVWHLGDFSMANIDVAEHYLGRLNGTLNLIWGNHDRAGVRNWGGWASSQYVAEIQHYGQHVTLCHYAMRVWNRSHHGSLMLYGHSHGNLPGTSLSQDVGVDAWDFRPVTLPEIIDRMARTVTNCLQPNQEQSI